MNGSNLKARALLVRVDRSQRRLLSRQIEEQLRGAIRSGTLAGGCALPSTRALAEDLGVSRGVIVRVYDQLAAEGYLDLRRGAAPSVRRIQDLNGVGQNGGRPISWPNVRYDLRPHQPDLSSFPRSAWLRSLRRALQTAADADLGYIDPRGLSQLRVEIATYLGRARGVYADPERVVVTAGSTHSVSLIARALAQAGTRELGFENPSHFLLHRVAEQAGLQPKPVAVDRDGLDVSELGASGAAAVVVSPAHQFPMGVVLAADRRAALVRWARQCAGLIIEDDYDAEFRYDRAPIGALQGLAPDHVAYIGSTSKTLSPGIRLGWAVLPDQLVEPVGEELHHSVLHLSGADQLALADFFRCGEFERHMRRMRITYRRKRDATVRRLRAKLPELPVRGIAAGLHVMLELGSQEAESTICAAAEAHGVAIEALSEHALPGYGGPPGVLIGYAGLSMPAIPAAVDRLAAAVSSGISTQR